MTTLLQEFEEWLNEQHFVDDLTATDEQIISNLEKTQKKMQELKKKYGQTTTST